MPADAFFCSVTAAQLMGVPLPARLEKSSLLHVAVPAPRRALSANGVVGHKLQVCKNQLRMFGELRACSPELIWCQLATVLSLPDLVAAGDYLIQRRAPRTTLALLREAVRQYPGRRGKVLLRQALELLNDRSESRRESHLRVILMQANLTGLVANLEITTSGGWNYRGDLAFPDRKVVVEYQSDYHRESVQFRADMTRRSRLEADGWFVVLVNVDDLRNPGELVQRIRRVLASRPTFH
jgi:very-short-patch-repair endonuclease